ncbi:succinylglutamate desuccinylase/aspartoacylase family protein [Chitinophaga oryzae]|uniref:Succinylglutamate desuccinylase/aspartoacylase family protein n=1 Tax=Chitinophaga oryzae TaxID=2725414 RepID=A0AAE6ZBF1_9BACT|nr:M14 family metallopeptidase [Chitinophaga oryzae]QJB29841.1 succinylglutamate desuccinylase/aspartoacylase family protein [Chitinophaga oryzae]
MRKNIFVAALLLLAGITMSYAQPKPFMFKGQVIPAGTRASFTVPLATGAGDSVRLPFTVLHGTEPGPVLGLIAGVHGYEYTPILALQQLPDLVDVQALRGTVIVLHIANVQAFSGRSIYYNPADGKNLNRSFPGKQDGTVTERIAWFIAHDLFSRCNYVVDNHSGDGNEDLHPYAGYYEYGKQAAASREMAYATGFDWIMPAPANLAKEEQALYCNREAALQEIPSLTLECGRLGKTDAGSVDRITGALLSIMRHLKMQPGEPLKANQPFAITERASVKSEHTGMLKTAAYAGMLVRKGMKLATVTDFTGSVLQEITAPVDGVIVYMLKTPPVNKGEGVFSFGVLPK